MRTRPAVLPGPYGLEPAFREDFLSVESVRDNGGVLYPAATPPAVDRGVTLDGTTQYVAFPAAYSRPWFASGVADELSILIEFWPDFNWDQNAYRTFFDCDPAPNRYVSYKDTNALGNRINLYLGATTNIGVVPSASYSPLWVVGGRNQLLIAGKSGSTQVWFNGSVFSPSLWNAAWTKVRPTSELWVGMLTGGNYPFDGRITRFELYPRKLTPAECSNLWTKGSLA